MRRRVFISSSSESLEVAESVKKYRMNDYECIIWKDDFFRMNQSVEIGRYLHKVHIIMVLVRIWVGEINLSYRDPCIVRIELFGFDRNDPFTD